jgi:DNA repair exonuclease SbcCD ATPase subunit
MPMQEWKPTRQILDENDALKKENDALNVEVRKLRKREENIAWFEEAAKLILAKHGGGVRRCFGGSDPTEDALKSLIDRIKGTIEALQIRVKTLQSDNENLRKTLPYRTAAWGEKAEFAAQYTKRPDISSKSPVKVLEAVLEVLVERDAQLQSLKDLLQYEKSERQALEAQRDGVLRTLGVAVTTEGEVVEAELAVNPFTAAAVIPNAADRSCYHSDEEDDYDYGVYDVDEYFR